jgi:hypothetical protein
MSARGHEPLANPGSLFDQSKPLGFGVEMNDRLVLSTFCDLVGKTKIGQSAKRGQRHNNSRIVLMHGLRHAYLKFCI